MSDTAAGSGLAAGHATDRSAALAAAGRLTDEAFETPTELSTASISDALDSLGLPGSLHGIGALRRGGRIVGPVFTVTYEPVDATGGTVGDFLDDVPVGAVILIDNAGRTDCTVWGGIMSEVAHERGVAGTVINGTCRDVAVATALGYPIWSVSRFMRTGKDRVRVAAVQTSVTIDQVVVRPGDILVADDDGAVVVPAARWDEIVDIARHIDRVEEAIVETVRSGATLAEARARHGYHALQTRKDPS
jgi:regulator of RNase E activity RraA